MWFLQAKGILVIPVLLCTFDFSFSTKVPAAIIYLLLQVSHLIPRNKGPLEKLVYISSEEIRFLWNLKIYYCVQKSPLLDPILGLQIQSNLIPYFFNIHLILSTYLCLGISGGLFFICVFWQKYICISHHSHAWFITCPSQPSGLHTP